MANAGGSGGKGSTIMAIIIVILILSGIGSCVGGGSSSSASSKCKVCGKTFTNSDDRHSIALRNMCENCYSNYKWTQDAKEGIKKYNERYGK